MLVQSVTVKNFKLLGDFAVDGLRPVTLLGGDNGCGKTTLLESILLCLDRRPTPFPVITALRDHKRVGDDSFPTLFHGEDHRNPIMVSCMEGAAVCRVRARIDEEWKDEILPSSLGEDGGVLDNSGIVRRLSLRYQENNEAMGETMFKIQRDFPPVVPVFSGKKRLSPRMRFINARMDGGLSAGFDSDPDYLSALDKEGEERVRNALRIFVPRADGAVVTSVRERPGVAVLMDNMKMSSALLGAGIRKLLSLALVLHARSNGLFLLDEVTVGWHHSHLVDLWRLIFRACKERNHQVIATTHSDEGITAFAEAAAREGCEADACYVRLDRKDDNGRSQVSPAVYDHETLAASREMHWEVRG